MTARREPRQRGQDGKFLSAEKKAAFLARQEQTAVEKPAPIKPGIIKEAKDDEGEPLATEPEEAETPELEAKEEPAEAKVSDDPTSWPEPAQKAFTEVRTAYDAAIKQNEEIRKEALSQMKLAQAHERRAKWLEEAIAAAGFEIDPMAAKLFDYETREALDVDIKQRQQEAQQAQVKQLAHRHLEQMKAEASKAAKQHGLDAQDILWAYATAGQRWEAGGRKGPEPTLQDAVDERRALQAVRQQKANKTAPALVQTAPSAPAQNATKRFDNTPQGRIAFLRSQGHDIT